MDDTTNGISTPPAASDDSMHSSAFKRKRSKSEQGPLPIQQDAAKAPKHSPTTLLEKDFFIDVLEVFKKCVNTRLLTAQSCH